MTLILQCGQPVRRPGSFISKTTAVVHATLRHPVSFLLWDMDCLIVQEPTVFVHLVELLGFVRKNITQQGSKQPHGTAFNIQERSSLKQPAGNISVFTMDAICFSTMVLPKRLWKHLSKMACHVCSTHEHTSTTEHHLESSSLSSRPRLLLCGARA